MKINSKIFSVMVFLVTALAMSGCTAVPTTRRVTDSGEVVRVEKPLGVSSTLRFDDVPTPAGFSNLRDQSFIYQDGTTRVGMMRYSGRANASQVIMFFKTQMPLYNWDLTNIVEYGNITINFVKGGETCIVTIEPLAMKTILGVVISPKSGSINTGFGLKKGRF